MVIEKKRKNLSIKPPPYFTEDSNFLFKEVFEFIFYEFYCVLIMRINEGTLADGDKTSEQ